MDLNAYVLTMAIVAARRHERNRQTVPEPALRPISVTSGAPTAGAEIPGEWTKQ